MILIDIVLLVVVVAVVWIASRALVRRAPPRSTVVNDFQPATAGRSARDVEEALALLATCVQPRGTSNLKALVQLRISDHVPADWQFDLAQGTCTLTRGQADGAQLTLTASSHTWSELSSKRVGFAQAAMKGTLQSEGDTAILMRLDDEFSGSPDPSRLSGLTSNLSSTVITTDEAAGSPPVVGPVNPFFEALHAARADPNLSSDERRAAMVDALRKSFGSGADIRIAEGASVDVGSTSIGSSASGKHVGQDVRAAVQQALKQLPPGATREQKVAAIRAALQTMPNAGHFAALAKLHGPAAGAGTGEGVGGEVAGALLEGLLESLLGGS